MIRKAISSFILVGLSILLPIGTMAQRRNDSLPERRLEQPRTFYASDERPVVPKAKQFFSGVSLSCDLVGLACIAFSSYGQYEAAARINLKERFFPTLELGLGVCDEEDDVSGNRYKTTAPYCRIGCDYNFIRDIYSGNRLFVGLRYGFTTFKYDVSGPDMTDPVWGDVVKFRYTDISSSCHWGELVGGLETKLWGIIHLGWTARCRLRLSQKKHSIGEPWYIPGFGKNNSTRLGATFNVLLDI